MTPKDYQSFVEDFVHRRGLISNELTEKQIAEVILQMCACGDLVRHVRVLDGDQKIVYIPYAREQELLAQIEDLKSKITALQSAIEGIMGYPCIKTNE